MLWFLFFLICFSLGYPTLNRYDPRTAPGTSDSAVYYELVTSGPAAVEGHMRFRVLVPFVARPFYWLARGRVGSWNPAFFGLLMANALFTATTAYLLVVVGYRQVRIPATALVGAMLYLLNFGTANIWLSGFVDSGEGCLLMIVAWTLLSERWWPLPFWGVLGALAKESFVPLSIVYGATWWLVARHQRASAVSRGAWIALMAGSGLVTITVLQSMVTRHIVWPWEFAAAMNSGSGYAQHLASSVLDRNFWYIFGWLLPLGVWRLRHLPRAWIFASVSAAAMGLLLNAYYGGAPGTVARVSFNIAGPLLSLSVAILFCGPGGLRTEPVRLEDRAHERKA